MTVHIQRLAPRLERAGFRIIFYGFEDHGNRDDSRIITVSSPLWWYVRLLVGRSPALHYVITTRASVRFLAALFGLLRRRFVVLRIGGESISRGLNGGGYLERWMTIFALRHCSAVLGVNDKICAQVREVAPKQIVRQIPGFIPPDDDGSSADSDVTEFLASGGPRLIVCGQIVPPEYLDIYGLWDVLDMVPLIVREFPNARLVVGAYRVDGALPSALDEYRDTIKKKMLDRNVFVSEMRGPLCPLLRMCDVFLRPSHEDGDANSVREALFFGKPVVASSCVIRPSEVVTFQTGDSTAFADAVRKAVGMSLPQSYTEDNAARITELLQALIEGDFKHSSLQEGVRDA